MHVYFLGDLDGYVLGTSDYGVGGQGGKHNSFLEYSALLLIV